jgi:hypothetical protein
MSDMGSALLTWRAVRALRASFYKDQCNSLCSLAPQPGPERVRSTGEPPPPHAERSQRPPRLLAASRERGVGRDALHQQRRVALVAKGVAKS